VKAVTKRNRLPRGATAGSPNTPAKNDAPPPQEKSVIRTHLSKLVAGGSALVVIAVGALFTGIGEGAVNRLVDAFSSDDGTPSPGPTLAKDALTVTVRTDIGIAGDLFSLKDPVSEGPIAFTLVAGKLGEPWDKFLDHHAGAPVGTVEVSLVLTGHRNPGVRITGLSVEKLKTEEILAGTSITLTTQGEAQSIKVTANLDEPRPRVLTKDGVPYFADRNITLKDGEQESLKVTMTASTMLYRWVFALDYVDETGAAHQIFFNRVGRVLPDAGSGPPDELFTLTGPAPKYQAAWRENLGKPGFSPDNG
jgi:hypothetical protein